VIAEMAEVLDILWLYVARSFALVSFVSRR
jgi:hypothetical protein